MAASIIPMPSLLIWIIVQGNVGSLPGLFANLFTILMLVIIMLNHVRMEKEQQRFHQLFTFHTQSLPTALLLWHCPSVVLYSSDDGAVNGSNYRNQVALTDIRIR